MIAPIWQQSEITPIPAGREAEFAAWLVRNRVTDLDHPDSHYDYRGAFLAGATRDPTTGHWPDPWKQHGHESFSVESQYARPNDPQAGHWVRDQYVRPVTPSASTAPTYGVQDWVTILHNAARTPQDHPRYAEARQVAQLAVDNIDELQRGKSAAERTANAPGPVGSALVAFGHGASLGLAGDPQYLAQAHEANPWTSGIADVLGTAALGGIAAPLVAGAGPVAGGVALAGGLGAARGAIEPIPGLTRGESALAMGTGGAVAGAVAGKLVSKLVPVAVTVAKNVYKVFGGGAAKAVSPAVQDVAEAAVRAELKRLNVHPAVAERTVQAWKTGKVPQGAIDLPPMEPTVSRVGETITPMEPQLPTLRAQADVMATQPAYVRAGNPNNLPTGTGPMAPPQAGMPLGVPGTLHALEQHLGRPLTPPETQSVLERLLGPTGSLPRSYGRPP